MIRETVEAFVDAKMERADISEALYQVSADVGGPALIKRISQRLRKAVEAMLQTAQISNRHRTNSRSISCLQPWRARCFPCWNLDHLRPQSPSRESNSCYFASHTWRPRRRSAFIALKVVPRKSSATSGECPISPPASQTRGGGLGRRLRTVSTPSNPIDWRYAASYTSSTECIPPKSLQSAVSSTTRWDTDSIQAGIECGILGIRRNDEREAWH
jgi:hypothetical protein